MINQKKTFWIILVLMTFTLGACADFQDVLGNRPQSSQDSGGIVRAESKKTVKKHKSEPVQRDGYYYLVQTGDNLENIAAIFQVDPTILRSQNSIEENAEPVPGQKLYIPTKSELADTQDREKKGGKKNLLAFLKLKKSEENDQAESKHDQKKNKKQVSEKPKKEKRVRAVADVPNASRKVVLDWPLDGRMVSPFGTRHGRNHDGIDIGAPKGTLIKASGDGEVIHAAPFSSYGNLVVIKHQQNMFTAYAHLSQFAVSKGDKVKRGQIVGKVGMTGRTRAPHLHFEVRHKTESKDPLLFLPRRDMGQPSDSEPLE